MIQARRTARQRLKQATRAEYDRLTFAAKLTPAQKQILDLHFLQDLPICEIAFRLSCCESLIRKRLAATYDRIAKL